MLEIVPITVQRMDLYKEVRLRALHSDPSAFCSTYAREAAFPDEVWRDRCTGLNGKTRTGFLALEEGTACGLVNCFADGKDSSLAHVIGMWVAPTHRRTGLSTKLLDSIRAWAAANQFANLKLSVISNNIAATRLYERYGFTRNGVQVPYRNDASHFEVEMTLPL